ncbi:hypothetical protein [Paludisphaera sp.]|uniref:hypothetical protein n=1 Tax=Paludisphaera sp. TaxID=2017432 RepID=UPI00301D85E2
MTTPQGSREDWSRRLAPLRLDAEPLDEQLARRRGAFAALAAVTTAMAAAFLALFAAFGRWDVGLITALAFWLPIVGLARRDLSRLTRAVAEYARVAGR